MSDSNVDEWGKVKAEILADPSKRTVTIDLPKSLHRELTIERGRTGATMRRIMLDGAIAELERRRTSHEQD